MGIILSPQGYAEEHKTMLLRKDGKVIRVPTLPAREYEDATEDYKFADPEGYQKLKDSQNAYRESQGLPPGPAYYVPKKEDQDPNEVKIFDLSPDETIPGCDYPRSYSFPTACWEEAADGTRFGDPIFRAGIDPQSVLDEIKAKNGITGIHNVMPEGYTDDKAYRESQGTSPGTWYLPPKKKGDPDEVEIFQIPPDQTLSGCVYAASSTFPDICYEKHVESPADTSKIIFRAGKDPQSVLDAIKESQGVTGEYNVMPEGYTADWTLWEKYQKGLPLKDETATDNTAEVGKTQEEKR